MALQSHEPGFASEVYESEMSKKVNRVCINADRRFLFDAPFPSGVSHVGLDEYMRLAWDQIEEHSMLVPGHTRAAIKRHVDLLPPPMDEEEEEAGAVHVKSGQTWGDVLSALARDNLELMFLLPGPGDKYPPFAFPHPNEDEKMVVYPSYEMENGKIVPLLVARYEVTTILISSVFIKNPETGKKEKQFGENGEPLQRQDEVIDVKREYVLRGFKDVGDRDQTMNSYSRVEKMPFDGAFRKGWAHRPLDLLNIKLNGGYILPDGRHIQAKDHQREAIEFAVKKGRCIVSLAPGLGKTLIGCEFANHFWKTNKRVLIVCPKSKIQDWMDEYQQWTGKCIDPKVLNKGKKRGKSAVVPIADVMAYESMLKAAGVKDDAASTSEEKILNAKSWVSQYSVAVFDECHRMKGADTQVAKHIVPFLSKIPYSIMLSGTPMPNRPSELFNLLHIADPGVFPIASREAFEIRYCGGYVIHEEDDKKKDRLAFYNRGSSFERELEALTSLYMYKNPTAVGTDKELIRTQVYCKGSEDDTEFFDARNEMMRNLVVRMMKAKPSARLKLKRRFDRQVLDDWYMSGHFKVNMVVNAFDQSPFHAKEPNQEDSVGDRVVFFLHHVKYVKILYDFLTQRFPGQVCQLTGADHARKRQSVVNELAKDSNSKLRYGVFTTNAMGEGINLVPLVTKIVIVETEFRPSAMLQAEKRIHRIGSVKDANTYWIHNGVGGTIDDWTMERVQAKLKVNHRIVGEDPASVEFDADMQFNTSDAFGCNEFYEQERGRKGSPPPAAAAAAEEDEDEEEEDAPILVDEDTLQSDLSAAMDEDGDQTPMGWDETLDEDDDARKEEEEEYMPTELGAHLTKHSRVDGE